MIKIKICGITNIISAQAAIDAGADYLGIVLHPSSPRYVADPQALINYIQQQGATPVAVCVDHDADEIHTLCDRLSLQHVQLHGERARQALPDLNAALTTIVAIPIDEQGRYDHDLQAMNADYFLFDSAKPGSGSTVKYPDLSTVPKPFFLAGGLDYQNVNHVIAQHQPHGVDVSSSVEIQQQKSPEKMQQFIDSIHPVTRYDQFGGTYMPELLIEPINAVANAFNHYRYDADFLAEFNHELSHYVGRSTPLTEVKRFQRHNHGPRVFLKREDLLHTGAHKINNALGQCLLAKRMGKRAIIAETGAGQHGVATATACARLGLACKVYMGAKDMQRQAPNVQRMRLLGAEVIPVEHGQQTLKDAVNAALRDWAESFADTHYCLGSALGPFPYPQMVAFFQAIIGSEAKQQCQQQFGRLPDEIIACIGGGSNAIGIYQAFLEEDVRLIGVEAGGNGKQHAARFRGGSPGVLHGCYSYLLQDEHGQVQNTHSISAGLDYPMIGPQHAALYESGRVQYTDVTDDQAVAALQCLAQSEGIIAALESSHALAYYIQNAKHYHADDIIVINLSGRGDKDLCSLPI